MEPRGSQFPGYQWACVNPACRDFGLPETPGAEPGLSDALRFVLAADEIDRLRQELESAREQLAAKDEALSQIKFIASLTDGKCKWDHKEQFELIVSMARVALKESQESKKV
jgi:hypothetical protein